MRNSQLNKPCRERYCMPAGNWNGPHSLRKLVAIGKRYGVGEILSEDDVDFIESVYRGRYPAEEGLLPKGEPTCEETERIVRTAPTACFALLSMTIQNEEALGLEPSIPYDQRNPHCHS